MKIKKIISRTCALLIAYLVVFYAASVAFSDPYNNHNNPRPHGAHDIEQDHPAHSDTKVLHVYHPDPHYQCPDIPSVVNFRDFAGNGLGYRAMNHKHVRVKALYRSGLLRSNLRDKEVLKDLHITSVLDLRTSYEIMQSPIVKPIGSHYEHIDIFDKSYTPDPPNIAPEDKKIAMENMYRDFVGLSEERKQFALTLREIALSRGAVIYESSLGKDRVGWVSAMLLSILGVARKDIERDYLLSNASLKLGPYPRKGSLVAQENWLGKVADINYLRAAFNSAERNYGSVTEYLHQGLGLDDDFFTLLQSKYLV